MNIPGFGKPKCQKCGRELTEADVFCPSCGTPTQTGRRTCPHCGAPIAAAANFCPQCGKQIQGTVEPTIAQLSWAKAPTDFAARIEVQDVPGTFRKDLIIEPGTRAIFLLDGRNEAGEVPPGRYTMDSLFGRILNLGRAKTATVILVDAADVPLSFSIAGVQTKDPLSINMDCRLVTHVSNAMSFLTTVMKGQRTVTVSMLTELLSDQVQNAAAEALRRYSVTELSSDLTLKEELATHIEMHLNDTLKSMGLVFTGVSALNFRHEHWDAIRRIQEEYFLQISEKEAQLAGRKPMSDLLDREEVQTLVEEERKVAHFQQRAQILARMRQAVLSDKMDEITNSDQLAAFLRAQDREKLVADHELADFQSAYAEGKVDHEEQRRYLARKLDIERQKELDRMAFEGESELLEMRLKRREMELRSQLNEEHIQAVQRKQTELDAEQIELQKRLLTARNQAEVEAIEREQDRADVQLGVYALELMDARRIKTQRDEMLLDAEREEKALERRLREQAEQHRLDMETRAQELERLRVLGQQSVEVLMTVAGPEQAALLADLKRTEALKGMTSEQILAMAAEKSPAVAQAFQEKFRGLSDEQQKGMYERLIEAEKASKDDQGKLMRETMTAMERLFDRAVTSQKDTATAFAGGRSTPPIIITSGGGTTMGGAGVTNDGTTRMVVCRKCSTESPVGTKYCRICGTAFFTEG